MCFARISRRAHVVILTRVAEAMETSNSAGSFYLRRVSSLR